MNNWTAVGVGVIGLVLLCLFAIYRNHRYAKKSKRPSRKEVAAVNKIKKAYEAKRDQEWTIQGFKYKEFKDGLVALAEEAKIHNWSLFRFTKEVLERTEDAIIEYENQCTKKHLIDQYMPNYFHVCMKHASDAIVLYSGHKGLSAIGDDLMCFVENNFRLKGIQGVFYRHRQHLHYSERCEAMAVAILSYFGQSIAKTTMDYATKPFDYLGDEDMTDWESVAKEFYRSAIDKHFAEAVKSIERENYSAQARRDNQEHQKSRRQRAARIKKQSKKARRMNYA
uniref:Uncharacterized protein n=1 Tax=Burkholderia phage vB_BgluM-SURPRISE13 TaxID=3159457 RepID=A0AAU7PF54_9VIRU